MDMYTGRVFQNVGGLSRYRCVMKDRDGLYIMRSIRSPQRLIAIREIDLITKWRVIG